MPPALAATTFVYRIFGGRLRSQIRCDDPAARGTPAQAFASSTYDPFLDLSLEINRAASLEGALRRFTEAEVLDGDNRYRLPQGVFGGRLVRATKRITVEEAPSVLTVHLKRFEFGGRGHKVTRRVEFSAGEPLDLGPFMSAWPACGAQLYDLFAVLAHHGHSLHSGHYTCYVRGPGGEGGGGGGGGGGPSGGGQWHLCDDHSVHPVSQRQVEAATSSAYMLFFTRRHPKKAEAGGKGKKKEEEEEDEEEEEHGERAARCARKQEKQAAPAAANGHAAGSNGHAVDG